jgi:hypothetical protein
MDAVKSTDVVVSEPDSLDPTAAAPKRATELFESSLPLIDSSFSDGGERGVEGSRWLIAEGLLPTVKERFLASPLRRDHDAETEENAEEETKEGDGDVTTATNCGLSGSKCAIVRVLPLPN